MEAAAAAPPEPSPLASRLLPRLSSSAFATNLYSCSPIWYGIFAVIFVLGPSTMTMSLTQKLYTDQFGQDAYWLTTLGQIGCSLLCTPGQAYYGYLSQPHRWGRKRVLLFVSLLGLIPTASLIVTTNAYYNLSIKLAVACLGADSNGGGLLLVLLAWTTDWCKPDDKAKYFSILVGCLFGTVAFTPFVPKIVGIHTPHSIFVLSAGASLASLACVALVFPKAVPGLEDATPTMASRQFSMSGGFAQGAASAPPEQQTTRPTAARNFRASLAYLFGPRREATLVYLILNFCDTAAMGSIFIFLLKERHFTVDDMNLLMCVVGVFGFFIQSLGVPALRTCGTRTEALLTVGVGAMCLHFAVYAFVANKLLIIALEPLGALGYVAPIAGLALVSGSADTDAIPRDQGSLIGVLSACKVVASCVGPLLLALCNSTYKYYPYPINWPGFGFSVLVVLLFVALLLSIKLLRHKEQPSCRSDQTHEHVHS